MPRDSVATQNHLTSSVLLRVLALFSLVSLLSGMRLVAELRRAVANLQMFVDEQRIGPMVGVIDLHRGTWARMPLRWVFPIFYGAATTALIVLLIQHVTQ